MAAASGLNMAPMGACSSISGNSPANVVSDVSMTGRKRMHTASSMACPAGVPSATRRL